MKNTLPEYTDGSAIGSESWYRINQAFPVIISDGLKNAFDKLKSYWVGDVICSYFPEILKLSKVYDNTFFVVRVNTYEDSHCIFLIEDDFSENNPLIKQEIKFTDLKYSLRLFAVFEEGYLKIFLPSEY